MLSAPLGSSRLLSAHHGAGGGGRGGGGVVAGLEEEGGHDGGYGGDDGDGGGEREPCNLRGLLESSWKAPAKESHTTWRSPPEMRCAEMRRDVPEMCPRVLDATEGDVTWCSVRSWRGGSRSRATRSSLEECPRRLVRAGSTTAPRRFRGVARWACREAPTGRRCAPTRRTRAGRRGGSTACRRPTRRGETVLPSSGRTGGGGACQVSSTEARVRRAAAGPTAARATSA